MDTIANLKMIQIESDASASLKFLVDVGMQAESIYNSTYWILPRLNAVSVITRYRISADGIIKFTVSLAVEEIRSQAQVIDTLAHELVTSILKFIKHGHEIDPSFASLPKLGYWPTSIRLSNSECRVTRTIDECEFEFRAHLRWEA